jgi:hypothetical protein
MTVAIDPFGDMSAAAGRGIRFDYRPIVGLTANLVLVTHEHPDHNRGRGRRRRSARDPLEGGAIRLAGRRGGGRGVRARHGRGRRAGRGAGRAGGAVGGRWPPARHGASAGADLCPLAAQAITNTAVRLERAACDHLSKPTSIEILDSSLSVKFYGQH